MPQLKPQRVLEIGAYEGAATCYLMQTLSQLVHPVEIHCVDTWEGGHEHQPGGTVPVDMGAVEQRFHQNVAIAQSQTTTPVELVIHKQRSLTALAELITTDKLGYFDFIYIDGSHQAPDVLTDATLAFPLLRVGGMIAFDDYLWSEHAVPERDPLQCPKAAIDAFTNLFFRKVAIARAPLYQIYVTKVSD